MAGNESIATVPANVADPLQLRKFLLSLIERLDIVLGYRGQDPYVSTAGLQTSAEVLAVLPTTLQGINTRISELEQIVEEVADLSSSTREQLDQLSQAFNSNSLLGAAYFDMNYTGYANLAGWYEFTALGSAITNPPAALVPATSYTVLIHVAKTLGGGIAQEVYMTSATTKTYHKRAGSTFALTLSLGWF